ncbi:MAG: hypothetical protein RLZZ299_366 [Pseudomonadota bacterium]
MKRRLLDWIVCPACAGPFELTVTRAEHRPTWSGAWTAADSPGSRVEEILEGSLACTACGADHAVTDGIPRLMRGDSAEGPATGHRWTKFDEAVPAYEALLRELIAPLGPDDLLGARVLDAGCGFGRHAFYAARWGAEVFAIDSSAEAVASARHNLDGQPRAHVIQADAGAAPFRPGTFGVVFAFGLLHHVPEPRRTFRDLDALVAPGGRLLTWVCGPRQGVVRVATGALRGAAATLEPEHLYRMSQGLAGVLRVISHAPQHLADVVPGARAVVTHLPVHDHWRWPFDVVVADIYDRLRVPLTTTLTGETLEGWYGDAGYADIEVTRRVRNTETFIGRGTRR